MNFSHVFLREAHEKNDGICHAKAKDWDVQRLYPSVTDVKAVPSSKSGTILREHDEAATYSNLGSTVVDSKVVKGSKFKPLNLTENQILAGEKKINWIEFRHVSPPSPKDTTFLKSKKYEAPIALRTQPYTNTVEDGLECEPTQETKETHEEETVCVNLSRLGYASSPTQMLTRGNPNLRRFNLNPISLH